jgi:hypothetical protein
MVLHPPEFYRGEDNEYFYWGEDDDPPTWRGSCVVRPKTAFRLLNVSAKRGYQLLRSGALESYRDGTTPGHGALDPPLPRAAAGDRRDEAAAPRWPTARAGGSGMTPENELTPITVTFAIARTITGLGLTTLWKLGKEKRIEIVRIGGRTLITYRSLQALLTPTAPEAPRRRGRPRKPTSGRREPRGSGAAPLTSPPAGIS